MPSVQPADVHYAAKAFLTSHIVKWLAQEGLSLDVCSGGELRLALLAGFPAGRIALHGSNKSQAELQAAVDAGIGAIVVDSFDEIGRLAGIAEQVRLATRRKPERRTPQVRRIPVMIRVTVGVEAHTHEFIATAHEDQKFGFSLAGGDAAEGVRRIVACPGLELVGLHSHIGSQIFDPSGFEVSAHRLVLLLKSVIADHPQLAGSITTLDLGGGLGIAYTSADTPPPVDAMAKSLTEIVERECQAAGLAVPQDRGRARPGHRRPRHGDALRGRHHQGRLPGRRCGAEICLHRRRDERQHPNRARTTPTTRWCWRRGRRSAPAARCRVVGKHCESGDIVVRDCYLPSDLAVGDLLAVAATGAYCYAMASNYNRLPRPPLVAVTDGSSRQLLRRETDDDLMLLETW